MRFRVLLVDDDEAALGALRRLSQMLLTKC